MLAFIIRSVLTLSTLFFTIYLFYSGSWGWGISLIFVLALFVLTFFRNESMILALNQMRVGNQEKAKMHINRISRPDLLPKRQHAYVLFLKAMLNAQDFGHAKSEQMLRKTMQIGLRTAQDNALAKMHLAGICAQTGRKNEATNLLSEAKKLDKNGVMKEQISMMQKQLSMAASKNQMRMVMMNKGRQKGPKMR